MIAGRKGKYLVGLKDASKTAEEANQIGKRKTTVFSQNQKLILARVSVTVFDQTLFAHYGIKLNEAEREWFAIDGKELRGSIESGAKRGAAVVQAVSHACQQVVAQDYYSGEKESEVPIVRKLLNSVDLASQKISLDALHCKAATLEMIAGRKGKYLVGLKDASKTAEEANQIGKRKTTVFSQNQNSGKRTRTRLRRESMNFTMSWR
jgi:predicted transposase YbfD/YdcC